MKSKLLFLLFSTAILFSAAQKTSQLTAYEGHASGADLIRIVKAAGGVDRKITLDSLMLRFLQDGTISAMPAGSNSQVQFNSSNSFGASPYFLFADMSGHPVLTLENTSNRAGSLILGNDGMYIDYNGTSGTRILPNQSGGSLTLTVPASAGGNGNILYTDGSGNLNWTSGVTWNGSNNLAIGNTGVASGNLQLLNQNGSNITLTAGTGGSCSWTLPVAQGASGTALVNDGSGHLSWAPCCRLEIIVLPDSADGAPVTSYTLQANRYNVLGDTISSIMSSDTLYFPSAAEGDVIEVKTPTHAMSPFIFIGIGCYVNPFPAFGDQTGNYCKWTFHNGKWY